jgi:NAD-dependent DNA ligase
MTSPEKEMSLLKEALLRWSQAYFEQDDPEVPDVEYDAAMRRLQALEAAHPEWATCRLTHAARRLCATGCVSNGGTSAPDAITG